MISAIAHRRSNRLLQLAMEVNSCEDDNSYNAPLFRVLPSAAFHNNGQM